MRNAFQFIFFGLLVAFMGCQALVDPVKETSDGFEIKEGISFKVTLKTSLNSNINQRGDQFVTQLKEPLLLKNKTILPQGTEIRGLIKQAAKYMKFGDRAGLVLLFDQIALKDGSRIPITATLDTKQGSAVIKIKGKGIQDAKIVGGSAIVGALIGNAALKEENGMQKGLIIGAATGTGAVFLSNRKEIDIPLDTELIIKIEERFIIPKI